MRHRSILFQGIVANAFTKLLSGNMPMLGCFLLFTDARKGEIQGLPYKDICSRFIAGVLLADQMNDFLEILCRHMILMKLQTHAMQIEIQFFRNLF